MTRALELLRDAARDEWSDPVLTARLATEGLLELAGQDWAGEGLEAVRMLRRARADSPLLLAVTEAALDPSSVRATQGLRRVYKALQDETWTTDLGLQVAHLSSLGVMSLAADVLRVLETAAQMGESVAELYTDRRAVARGLGYLGLPVEVAPPEEAEALLLPAQATQGAAVWASERALDVALAATVRGRRVVIVAHPLSRLSPLSRSAFRPPARCEEGRLSS